MLLTLVRREGYPLDRLPVAPITAQFLTAVARLRARLPAEGLADSEAFEMLAAFAETASWLVLLKSRSLLPPVPTTQEPDAPEAELSRALLGRAELQQAAALLRERMEAVGLAAGARSRNLHTEVPPNLPVPVPSVVGVPLAASVQPASRLTIADAVRSARRALDAVRACPAPDLYPTEAELARLEAELALLMPGRAVPCAPWFAARPEPASQTTLLLALLELARLGHILLHQSRNFGPLSLKRIEASTIHSGPSPTLVS